MLNIGENILKKALGIALDKGHSFAEIFCEKTNSVSISLEDNKIEKIRSGIDQGIGFRIINGEKTYYGYVNSLEDNALLNLAREVSSLASSGRTKTLHLLQQITPHYQPACQEYPSAAGLEKKIKYLESANQTARKYDKRISQASVRYVDSEQNILIANSNGILAKDKRIRTRFAVEAIARTKNMMQTGYEGPGAASGLELFQEETPEKTAREAARRAVLGLEADPAPAGPMPVVLAGSAGGTMIHEACGHALEADFIYKKTSLFSGKLGKKIFSPLITVIDDGTIPGKYGSASFDDEGTPCRKNVLIEQGVLTGFMNDYLYGTLLEMPLTGNGRRESYRQTPIPRMTNTYIQAGSSKYAEILASVDKGLLVKKMGGGQVDITNGNFVFEITEGYLIKNGQADQPVRGATLVGNGIEVLSTVDMVGDDLYFIPGVCGKGQHAPVSDGQPSLRIPNIIVGGQKQ